LVVPDPLAAFTPATLKLTVAPPTGPPAGPSTVAVTVCELPTGLVADEGASEQDGP
jgi:hypothetical protein